MNPNFQTKNVFFMVYKKLQKLLGMRQRTNKKQFDLRNLVKMYFRKM